jgi:cytochrome P450
LLTVEGSDHTRQRRTISYAFHYDGVACISPIFEQKAAELAEWPNLCATPAASRAMHSLTIDTIVPSTFGRDSGSIRGERDDLSEYEQILSNTVSISAILPRMSPFSFLPLPKKLRGRQAQKRSAPRLAASSRPGVARATAALPAALLPAARRPGSSTHGGRDESRENTMSRGCQRLWTGRRRVGLVCSCCGSSRISIAGLN